MNAKPRTLSGILPVISGLISLVLATSTEAATITWGTPVAVDTNAPAQVTNGVMIGQAFSGQASVMAVNGVVFTNNLSEVMSGSPTHWPGPGPNNTDYSSLLAGGLYVASDNTITISNLTVGKQYILQVFTAFSSAPNQEMQLGNSSDYSSGSVLMGNTYTAPTFVNAAFTADATTQSFHWRPAPGSANPFMGAINVREVGSVDKSAITWAAPVAVDSNDPTQVSTVGTLITAVSGMASSYTLNGVTFTGGGLAGRTSGSTGSLPDYWGAKPTDYAKMLNGGLYKDQTPGQAVTTLSGLAVGNTYLIQVFSSYVSDVYDSVAMTIASGATPVDMGNTYDAPTYVIGTFTANATTKSFVWGPTVRTGADLTWLAAVQIREVPPPPPQGTVFSIQ